jgi:hypothetical protein
MSRLAVPALSLLAAALAALGLAVAKPAGASASGACRAAGHEVRFDDGRLLVTRDERAVDPRVVRERWWACWRPSGRRSLLADARHLRGADDLALTAVRRGRFVVLGAAGRLDVYDGRLGRTTATVPQVGVVRELAVTPRGRAAVLQDTGSGARQLWAGSGTRGCFVDAGQAKTPSGDVFADLTVHGERLEWHREAITFGSDLSRLDC